MSVLLVAAIVGCQRAPEPAAVHHDDKRAPPVEPEGAEPTGKEPLAPVPRRPGEPAAEAVTRGPFRHFDAGGGFRLPGTIVAVELRSFASLMDAALSVADAVQPGIGMMLRQVIAGGAGFDDYDRLKSSLGEKPAALLILNPEVHPGLLVCAFGVEDGEVTPEFVVKVAKVMGLDFRKEPGGFSVEVRPGVRLFFRLVVRDDGKSWAVGALGPQEGLGTLDAAVEALRAGRVPRAPAGGDHLAAHVDMVELRKAFGARINQGLMMMRAILGADPRIGQSPVLGRLMQELATALDETVKGFDGFAISLKISPEAVEITQRMRPAAGSVFEPLAEKPQHARWTVADILPPEAPMAVVMRIDEETLQPLAEALVKGVLRAASGGEPDAGRIDDILGLFSKVFGDGLESAVAIADYSAQGPVTIGAATTDFEVYRAMQRQMLEFMSLFDDIWKDLGIQMKVDYQPDVGRLDGRPVDRMVTSIEAAGPNAAMMEQALAQFGGQMGTAAEFVGTPEGVIYATGKEPRKLLEEALKRRRETAGFEGTGWATASAALRKLLERAPERTWCAGEVRLGAYLAIAMRSTAQNMPIQFPDTAVLTENDPPLAFWVAAEGGEIVSRFRVPVVSVKNLVTFFKQFAMQFVPQSRPPAVKDEFEFKDEGFDDEGW